jgi:N-acyl-D-aspartate/D-glutamate deacylase
MHDLVIRGGTIVDGGGGKPFAGDVAIDGGRLSAVGGKAGPARREIDADGLIVTPGFVDVHTHLDAQIGWDPVLSPLSWHGVTTALLGNCGVTFAPCKPADRSLLAEMMETVEDIPREAILSGLPWDWESYGEYLDSVDRGRPAINVAGLVGHCAVRFEVMGERAVEELASEEEIARMAAIVGAAIDDGAVGFSTSRLPGHVLPDGRAIPGTYAAHEEMTAIGHAVAARDGLMQNVLDFQRRDMGNGELLRRLGTECGNRLLFSYTLGPTTDAAEKNARHLDRVREGGLDITALTMPRGSGFIHGLQSHLPAYDIWGQTAPLGPTWTALKNRDLPGRLAAIADPATRAALIAEAKAADEAKLHWVRGSYWLGDGERPNYLAPSDRHLGALAQEAGEHWSETYLRLAERSHGLGLFVWRWFSANIDSVEQFLTHEAVLPGLTDAGAHVAMVMDCAAYTFILSHWVRDASVYSLAEGVRRITAMPARVIGLRDRGMLRAGMAADVNVIDLADLGEDFPRLVHDFPGGAPRYIQRSHGYIATLVNGEPTFAASEHQGTRAGRVLRHRRAH